MEWIHQKLIKLLLNIRLVSATYLEIFNPAEDKFFSIPKMTGIYARNDKWEGSFLLYISASIDFPAVHD